MQPALLTAATLHRLRGGGYAGVQKQTVRRLCDWLAGDREACDAAVRACIAELAAANEKPRRACRAQTESTTC